jgi:hypothetical protein
MTDLDCTAVDKQTLLCIAVNLTVGTLSLCHSVNGNIKEDMCLTALHFIGKFAMYGNAAFGILYSAVNYDQ